MRVLLSLLLLFGLNPLYADQTEPEKLITNTTEKVLETIRNNSAEYKEEPAKLFALIDEIVLPHFDFQRMANLALGRYRRKINDQQKTQLTDEFRTLLVRTYGKALLEYTDEKVIYLPMRGSIKKGDVTVRTEIDQGGGFPIPLNYNLYQADNGWKVYDISVDNISLVTNYRSSFAREIKKNGIDGLIKTLRERNQGQ